ncbi:MAG: phage tail sheath subtilisin-like domain-containing protein [Myxococcota bacterium]
MHPTPPPPSPETTQAMGDHPIVVRSMAIAAFLGTGARGPLYTPITCATWSDYVAHWGDFMESGVLAHAVHGFFTNGGQQCVVVGVETASAESVRRGLALLEKRTEVGLVAAPGWSDPAIHEALLSHCEAVGPRMAILDPPRELPGRGVDSLERPRASQWGAFYFPWIVVHDGHRGDIAQPPSGHVAGIFARVDRERGVHYAPADAVVRGALGVTWEVNQREHDILHPKRINAIRPFNKRGIRIWGANTLAETGFRLIASKRTLDMVALSIQEGTRWVEEAPHSPETHRKVKVQVTEFLNRLWDDGLLPGGEGEGFMVRCDASLQTPEVESAGAFVLEVAISLNRPRRWIRFRVVHGG